MIKFLNKKEFKIFLMFFLIYVTFAQLSGWTARSRIDLAIVMAYNHTLSVDNIWTQPPFDTIEVIKTNNHYYIEDAPGDSFLALPVTFLFKTLFGYPQKWHFKWLLIYLMVVSVSCLTGALTCILVYKASRFYTQKESHKLLVTIAYGLGTSGMFISTRMIGESTATFFVFFSFYLLLCMWKEQNLNRLYFFLSGILSGLAILSAYESGLVVLVCLVFASVFKKNRIKNILSFLMGLAIVLGLLFLYNYAIFQNPLDIGFFHGRGNDSISKVHPLFELSEKNVLLKYASMFRLMFAPGLGLTDGLKVTLSNVIHILFFTYRGLFVYSSFLIFSFIGLLFMGKKNRLEQVLVLIIFLIVLLFAASNLTWWAYEGLSCRRLSFAIPFLMIPLAHLLSLNKHKKMIILTAIVSILIHVIGMQTPIEYGLFYETKRTVLKHTFLCMYQNIANPVKDFYFPLFIKFGPRSFFVEMILGRRLPHFLNILGLSFLITIVWYKTLKNFFLQNKKLFFSFIVIILILAGLRITFSSEITKYTIDRYNAFYLEQKQCKPLEPNFFTAFFLLDYKVSKNISDSFTIPYLLKVNESLPLTIGEGKNWGYPGTDNIPIMYQDATLVLDNKLDSDMIVSLEFNVSPYASEIFSTRTLELYLNGKHIKSYTFVSEKKITENIALKGGRNEILFHSKERCITPYELASAKKELFCINFLFKEININ